MDYLKKTKESLEKMKNEYASKMPRLEEKINSVKCILQNVMNQSHKIINNTLKTMNQLVGTLGKVHQDKMIVELDLDRGQDTSRPSKWSRGNFKKKLRIPIWRSRT